MANFIIKPWYKKDAIYGASWESSSSTQWTRTDGAAKLPNPNPYYLNMSDTPSSPFDNIMPWAGIVRVSDANAGELVAIPKFYFKLDYANTTEPRGLKIQISENQFAGSQVSPAHMDRGDGQGERDVVYVGRYHCASDYKSKTGVQPTASKTRATFRTGIHNLGANIWQWDYAAALTIQMLYLVEFADWNISAKIGGGRSPSTALMSMGYTDSMPYHTGTTATSRQAYSGTQYRYIEGLWDNVYDFCDGVTFSSSNIYATLNPSKFSDSIANLTNVGIAPSSSGWINGYTISTSTDFEWLIYPSQLSQYMNTIPFYADYTSAGVVLDIGGGYTHSQGRGFFYLSGFYGSSDTNNQIGSRLMKL